MASIVWTIESGTNHPSSALMPSKIHKKIGHISTKALKYLVNRGMVLGLELKNLDGKIACDVCIRSKITCKPLPKELGERSKNIGDKIYSDIWGLARHIAINKKIY